MYCDYPLDIASILKINLTKRTVFNFVIINLKILTDVNGFWSSKKLSINTLIVSHNDNISFSHFSYKCKAYWEFHIDSRIE